MAPTPLPTWRTIAGQGETRPAEEVIIRKFCSGSAVSRAVSAMTARPWQGSAAHLARLS